MKRWALASSLICLAAFATLALLVSNGTTAPIDASVLLWFRAADGSGIGPAWFEEAVSDITSLGSHSIFLLALLFTLCALLIGRHHATALFLLATIISGMVASAVLKELFARQRPTIVVPLDRTFTASFPSGHAMLGMLVWLALALVVARFVPVAALRCLVVASAIVLALLIGISRLYLGVHWPSDVLGGWIAGLGWASAGWLIAHGYRDSRSHGIR